MLLLAACSGDDNGSDDAADPPGGDVELEGEIDVELSEPEQCEHFDAGGCLLPFPSDHFTEPDDATATGRRVAFADQAMPVNADGVPVDPTEWNRDDGFSSGTPILVVLPGLDPEASGVAPITDIGSSLDDDAPIVLLDADTGERVPYWAELDAASIGEGELARSEAPTVADDQTALIVRPARNLTHGHRHVVALRDLVDADGAPIDPDDAFLAHRDRLETGVEAIETRRGAMEQVFVDLADAGVARDDLQLAWDFTVRSTEDATGRLLAMRDDAFEHLDDGVADVVIESSDADAAPAGARLVEGTFAAPNYLTDGGEPGSVLNNEDHPDGIPERNGERDTRFLCLVPEAPAEVMPSMVYGHGLLGSAEEAISVGGIATTALGVTVCAVDWIGMSSDDLTPISEMLSDFSDFRIIPDRLQQAHLNQLLLGRLLTHPDGFAAEEAFLDDDGEPTLEGEVVFVGASQGGILGGAPSAVGADWERAALIVPGQNYSTLLDRSVNFDPFAVALAEAYPSAVDRQVLLALAQQLWDRGENNAYSQNLVDDPLPGADPTRVLLLAVFGDHQVANVATDVLARTGGIPLREPGLEEGRSPDVEPFWGLDAIDDWPWEGSAYVMWDVGTPAPPTANVPPREGADPHGSPAGDPGMLALIVDFLLEDAMSDPCPEGQACTTP